MMGHSRVFGADLLPVLQTEGALAFVLAHEIGRVLARHTSEADFFFSGLHALFKESSKLASTESTLGQLLSKGSRLMASLIVHSKHDDALEAEADEIGKISFILFSSCLHTKSC
jgi:predicted Zn-dependent protease